MDQSNLDANRSKSRLVVGAAFLALAYCVCVACDLIFGLIGLSAGGYAFGAFSNSKIVSRNRLWFVPATVAMILIGGWLHRNEQPIWTLRGSLATVMVVGLVVELINRRESERSGPPARESGVELARSNELFGDLVGSARGFADRATAYDSESGESTHEFYADDDDSLLSHLDESNLRWRGQEDSDSSDAANEDSDVDSSSVQQESLISRMRECEAFDESTIAEVLSTIDTEDSFRVQLRACANANLLTEFQVEAFLAGKERSLRVRRYTVESVIGRGAMGIVFRAVDRIRKIPVAIKLFRKPTEQAARIRREMSVLEQLAHPNVVIALDVGEAEGRLYIAMEFIDGQTLHEVIKRRGPLSPIDTLRAILPIGSALDQAHQRGVLHRDIKPGNIIVSRRGEVKLLDLGISLPPEHLREFDTADIDGPLVCGTIGFMSPEQANGDCELDPRADIFSLGATLYYLLTGELFVEGENVKERHRNTRQGKGWRTIDSEVIAPSLATCITRMMAFEPSDRYQTISDALIDLKAAARDLGVYVGDSLIHVLVVEDVQVDQMVMQRLLERSNRSLEISYAADLASACDAIWIHTEASSLPLIVLMDMRLPDSTIDQTLKKIMELADDQVSFVAVTGVDDPSIRQKAMQAGVVDYLLKDDLTDQIVERVIFETFARLPEALRITAEEI